MDMRKLLEAMTKFAGEPEQKPGDQVRGTEVAKPTKSGKKHPFQGRLVGASESKENFLKDLSKVAEDTKVKRTLEDRWEEFKRSVTEDDLGVEPKRPSRKGSRPTRGHKPQERYQYQEDEQKRDPHKIISQKLRDIEREKNPPSEQEREEAYRQHIERMKAQQREYLRKNPNSIYKPIDETETSQPTALAAPQTGIPNPAGQTQAEKEAAKKALAATTQLKAATGTKAPPNVMMKALDVATQGKAIDPKSSQVLEPMLDVVAAAATDPKLANQFKTLANQARTLQKQQQAK